MKQFTKKILSIVMVLVLAACTTAAPTPVENGEPVVDISPIKIGFIGPLTGDIAALGADMLAGTQMRIDEVNAAGGINGRMIQLIAEDGRCNGSDAAAAAQKLANVNNVVALLGGQCSGEALAAAPVFNNAKKVMISAVASSPDVTDAGDFVFRNYPSDALKTKSMAEYLQNAGLTKVAVITENTDFSVAFTAALTENVGAENIVFAETLEPGAKDARTLLTRLNNVEFDVFVANGNSPAVVGAMLEQYTELGFTAPVISHDAADAPEIFEVAPEGSKNLYVLNVPALDESSDFGKAYAAVGNTTQFGLSFSAVAYDAAAVMFDTIAAVGTSGEAMRDYLYGVKNYEGVAATFGFDSNGDVIGFSYVLKKGNGSTFDVVESL